MGVKKYEMPDGRTAVFEYDENGIGKITIEAMDMLMVQGDGDALKASRDALAEAQLLLASMKIREEMEKKK